MSINSRQRTLQGRYEEEEQNEEARADARRCSRGLFWKALRAFGRPGLLHERRLRCEEKATIVERDLGPPLCSASLRVLAFTY
jgi:hypothetical protein